MHDALNSQSSEERNRHQYQRVVEAYRRVYYGAPASVKAEASVVAVAGLLAEMGRNFHNDRDLRSAVGQYKFLRREYPGSRNRFEALFNIAHIYQDDLKDPAQAKPVFEEFLRRYPRNHLADAARSALSQPVPAKPKAGESDNSRSEAKDENSGNDSQGDSSATNVNPAPVETGDRRSTLSHITNVRHWSNQSYTRVAIDLEQDAKFESQRIDSPERIVFDLQNTNPVSSLLGKTINVDDGLLKRIRVAQFQPEKSRIVLEVVDRSDYDTFLLTNPPRLIIDVHNKEIHPQRGAGQAKGNDRKPAKDQPVQVASLKQPETFSSSVSEATEGPRPAEVSSNVATSKLPVPATTKSRVPVNRVPTGNGPSKIVVEADDSDDQGDVTVAKATPPDINAPATADRTPSPSSTSKNSTRNKRRKAEAFPDAREASPTASGDRSLIRALGLKIGKIVIDPGHGGHDTGTIGPNGLEEKDLVLDVGRRLGRLLQGRLGADVVYTRKDDTFIPLETRTSIANQEQADLFVSIHANSSRDSGARGVETYYLNFTSSAEALDVAARENAASDKSIHELQDLVKKIALKEKIDESREFASNVQRALHSGLAAKNPGIRDRGVKKAPFIVLIGANMPSILAEVSFVSNPGDERRLRTPEYRQRIAESLYRGISKYVSGLSGIKVASKIEKGEGQ